MKTFPKQLPNGELSEEAKKQVLKDNEIMEKQMNVVGQVKILAD